jgi:FixJ family two-component response regulator/AraC-like DNA-binding protein
VIHAPEVNESSCGGVVTEPRVRNTVPLELSQGIDNRTRSAAATPDNLRPSAGTAKAALLWIDDEVTRESADVRLLELEGYRIHCAATGTAGLAMARAGVYEGILLDLRLPDISGLAVLTTLRAESIRTPVLVLTGFGDTDSAFAARHFGADRFECKPLFGDDLTIAVRGLLEGESPFADDAASARLANPVRAEYQSLVALLEGLNRLSTSSPDLIGSAGLEIRESMIDALVRGLTDSALPMPVFLVCASALKCVMDATPPTDSCRDVAVQESILGSLSQSAPSDSRVVAALSMLQTAAAQRKRLKREDVARTQGVDASHLSRLVKAETGFKFAHWRTAFLLRPCLNALAETDEHVQQIACGQLHYSDETQFVHEFVRMFGLSPTEFRRRWRMRPK